MTKPAVLLIGGLDPQGCAGIAADLATIQHHNCHGLPLITAMTQQSSVGLTELGAVEVNSFLAQYKNCITDFEIKAIKIGLIPNIKIAEAIEHIIQCHDVPVVLDPVLTSTSGGKLIGLDVQQFIINQLLPKVSVLTPNLPEWTQLFGAKQNQAAETLAALGIKSCLLKGGHADNQFASDYFISEHTRFYLYQEKHPVTNVRGTGCILASALAAQLAYEQDIRDAVVLAKAYISQGIRQAKQVGAYFLFHHSHKRMIFEDIPKLCYDKNLIGQSFNFPSCPKRLGIYPVVDSSDWINNLILLGINTIQLRIKHTHQEVIQQQISEAVNISTSRAISLFINDHWSLAIKYQAYGVHLGQEDLNDANLKKISEANLRLGVSTHSYWELARALAINPSYIALGPIYATQSKKMPFSPQGIARLNEWVSLLDKHYPVVAIGGINLERAKQLTQQTKVGSIAMISAITKADDYQKVTTDLLKIWDTTENKVD